MNYMLHIYIYICIHTHLLIQRACRPPDQGTREAPAELQQWAAGSLAASKGQRGRGRGSVGMCYCDHYDCFMIISLFSMSINYTISMYTIIITNMFMCIIIMNIMNTRMVIGFIG